MQHSSYLGCTLAPKYEIFFYSKYKIKILYDIWYIFYKSIKKYDFRQKNLFHGGFVFQIHFIRFEMHMDRPDKS